MPTVRTAPSGGDGIEVEVVGYGLNSQDTIPVAIKIGAEARGVSMKGHAISSSGAELRCRALGVVDEAGNLHWAMTSPYLLVTQDDANRIDLELPEIDGVTWYARLRCSFSG